MFAQVIPEFEGPGITRPQATPKGGLKGFSGVARVLSVTSSREVPVLASAGDR